MCFLSELYVFQDIDECEYGTEDLSDMVYTVKLIFNQKLLCTYDSRLGKYVGFDEFGIRNANRFNNQKWKMAQRRAELDTLCRANARYYINSTIRKGRENFLQISLMFKILVFVKCMSSLMQICPMV